jgi:ATP-dependent helicase/nuclease subunit A
MAKSEGSGLSLTSQQLLAVETWDKDVLVTAGAGSGKTRTLVARYMALLERGVSPRKMAAITFTEKAAREMRNRVRSHVEQRVKESVSFEDQIHWQNLQAQMDSARIGTIHSLCAEMIRTHPVEACVDPDFSVLEEGQAAALKAEAVQDTLAWATGQEETAALFGFFSTSRLSELLHFILDHRLDMSSVLIDLEALDRGWDLCLLEIMAFITREDVLDGVRLLKTLDNHGELVSDAGEKFAEQVRAFFSTWHTLLLALEDEDLILAAQTLFQIRREHMRMNIGKKASHAKMTLREIREIFDEYLAPWVGGARSSDLAPNEELERQMEKVLPRLEILLTYAMSSYRAALDATYSLDFDDLECKALEILQHDSIVKHWQLELQSVLVDEYQDTNARQQQIIQALCAGRSGSLFVVGDARQSIYRFRGADVTVFRRLQEELKEAKGAVVELDLTFRAHPGLLRTLDGLLAPILGTEDLPDVLYHVPYTRMESARDKAGDGIRLPFIEFLCGIGPSAEEARPVTAQILVQRLVEMYAEGQIRSWDDVALLFRASAGFQPYEEALESAGIPFVTVAGRGFYNRPEIRDLLNILKALADPEDDLAMAGLLRSPAFALSDAAIYQLRWDGTDCRSIWEALGGDLSELSSPDRECAERAHRIVASLIPLVDRLTVAELIKGLIDLTDYRAVMASSQSRLWRNVDKLLRDAHKSGIHRVRAFLDYIQTLRDVGVREGEAPAEAEGSVQLMTIHRAKGLQFEIVVLADASRGSSSRAQVAYLSPGIGLSVKPDRMDEASLIAKLAQWKDKRETLAEEHRLLYVALTRAREKVLINGYLSETRGGLSAWGWLKEFFEVIDIELPSLADMQDRWIQRELPSGDLVALWVGSTVGERKSIIEDKLEWPESQAKPLYQPLSVRRVDDADADEQAEPARDWRATGERVHAPAAAVGRMVHEAIRRWIAPQDPSLDDLLENLALQEGLVDTSQRRRAVRESRNLLERFWADPLRESIEQAEERYRELPYTLSLPQGGMDIGTIDLFYRDGEGWTIVDFKTDELRDREALDNAVEYYLPQMMRYKRAIRDLLNTDSQVLICFLDYQGEVECVEM